MVQRSPCRPNTMDELHNSRCGPAHDLLPAFQRHGTAVSVDSDLIESVYELEVSCWSGIRRQRLLVLPCGLRQRLSMRASTHWCTRWGSELKALQHHEIEALSAGAAVMLDYTCSEASLQKLHALRPPRINDERLRMERE